MTVTIEAFAADSPVAQGLLDAYFADRALTFIGGTYTPKPADPATLAPPSGAFLVARDDDCRPIGCGALRRLTPSRFEVKHLYVAPLGRGRGTGAALLAALETEAVPQNCLDRRDGRAGKTGSARPRSQGLRDLSGYAQ